MKLFSTFVLATAVLLLGGCSGSNTPETAESLSGIAIPGDDSTDQAGAPDTFTCGDLGGVAGYCADHGVTPDSGGTVHVVCINDFAYYPSIVLPKQGDVVAWVNVEKCADPNGPPVNAIEGLFANVFGSGCDTHHEVVTAPDQSALNPEDTVSARLCSRFPSVPAKPGTPTPPNFAIDPGACPGHTDETGNNKVPGLGDNGPKFDVLVTPTNVFCHKFTNVGSQHYSCFTNPAHAAVLHGGVVVLPAQAPAVPDLPQEPQF